MITLTRAWYHINKAKKRFSESAINAINIVEK